MSEEYPDPPVEPATVAPETLAERLAAGEPIRLLDVRNRDEYERWHVAGPSVTATQVPFAKALQAQVTDGVADLAAGVDGEGPITVVCARGEASAYVAGLLADAGIDARNLDGGMQAWARVYEARDLTEGGTTIRQYHRPSSGCLAYMVVSAGEAAVVDPLRAFTDRYVADARDLGANVQFVVDTHVHADHVSGLRPLADAVDATALVSERAHERGVTGAVERLPEEGLSVGDARLRPVALPGHTTGMTGFAVGETLLTGDSLFVESVARPDLEVGDEKAPALADDLYTTLTERLAAFDDATRIAPGHASTRTPRSADGSYTAALGDLRERLWVFDTDRATFVERVCSDLPPRPANVEAILAANLGETTPDEETAFEWELGPNNCAVTAD